MYGVIQSGDHKARTCVVKWVKLNSCSDDVEVSHQNLKNPDLKKRPLSSALCHPPPVQVLGTEEDVSVYDIADHPDFHFRTSDIVIRIWNSERGQKDCENGVRTAAGGRR